jgi:stage V sporulation protein R
MSKPLFACHDGWTESVIWDTLTELYKVADKDLGLSLFPNQILGVSDEGMLDAYASMGLPHLYPHWSFGKSAQQNRRRMSQGQMGLAYELIMPTDPSLMYCLSSNSMATMATVIAHAGIGHNTVFKNNHLYRTHTDARGLPTYCEQAKRMVLDFEARYGAAAVEETLDVAHALMLPCGIHRKGPPRPFDAAQENARIADYMRNIERTHDPLIASTIDTIADRMRERPDIPESGIILPQENILWFMTEYSPKLNSWQRELLRMVSTIAQQCHYPGSQVKILHEGSAMFYEEYTLRKLYEDGLLDDGTWLEIMHLNEGVLYQAQCTVDKDGNPKRLVANHNPYTFGLAMFKDIVRICGPRDDADRAFFHKAIDMRGPTPEDREHFMFAGSGNWREVLKEACADYDDASFIRQFLSPKVIRDFKLFTARDEGDHYVVTHIHDRDGYDAVREAFAESHSFDGKFPLIQITGVDLEEDRELHLTYTPRQEMDLAEEDAEMVVMMLQDLWGYDVTLDTM